ncbi:MAG TPA: ankyrin repeat domain-containing protein [Rhabdochlamydiaceae bacterium]|nr:ankyrin repeat domain-containing protein [Rhabdochlamydiaceae bacterium]
MTLELNLNKDAFQTSAQAIALQEAGILSALKALEDVRDLQVSDGRYIDLCQKITQLEKPLEGETLKTVIVAFDRWNLINKLFFFCVENGKEVLAKELLESGVPVDIEDENGRTALVVACTSYSPPKEIIRLLVDQGADIYAEVGDRMRPLIQAMARTVGKTDIVALLLKCSEKEAQKFIHHFASRFWVGHVNSMKGTQRVTFNGSHGFVTSKLIREILKTLPDAISKQIHSYHKGKLIKAFTQCSGEIKNFRKTALSIQKGDLVVVHSGFRGHSMFFVFYKGYMAICNRGNSENIEMYKIDSSKMSEWLLKTLLRCKTKKKKLADKYFYFILPKVLSPSADKPIQDEICKLIEELLNPGGRKIGNCAFVNSKLALRVALALLHIKKERGKWILKEEDVRRCHYFSKLVSTHIRCQKLEDYWNEYGNSDLFDADFAEDALEIALKHLEKTPEVPLDTYPNIKEYLTKQNSIIS